MRYFQTHAGVGWALQTWINKIMQSNIVWSPKQLFGFYYLKLAEPLCPTYSSAAANGTRAGSVSVSHQVISRVPLLLRLREDEDKNYVPMKLRSYIKTQTHQWRKLRRILTPHKHWLFEFHFWHCKRFLLKKQKTTNKQTPTPSFIWWQ